MIYNGTCMGVVGLYYTTAYTTVYGMADGLYYTTVCGMADTPAGGGHPGGRRTGGHPGGQRTGGHPGGHYSTGNGYTCLRYGGKEIMREPQGGGREDVSTIIFLNSTGFPK